MACRVGITTNLAERKAEWERRHPTLHNWHVLKVFGSREQAQAFEKQAAERENCACGEGGREPDSPGAAWCVYYFEY